MEKRIKTGSDYSGVGAFDQALERLGIKQDKKFACDMDKYARQTYILNFGKPKYYPENVYNREIPKESLDIFMTSPPCQSFSNAGKRLGEDDERGILFYNSHEFIKKNKPRFFIFENVKGLLSDDKSNKKQKYGKTFTTWLQYLGGKSINGATTLFPHEESVNYHIYHKVLNAKHYNIPQNRERVFIIGIRDDQDNVFSWPKPQPLKKRLIDVLEPKVDKKYYLSDKMINHFINRPQSENYKFSPLTYESSHSQCLTARYYKLEPTDPYIKIGAIRGRNPENPTSRKSGLPTEQMLEINENGTSNALTTVQKDNIVIEIKSANKKGYETAEQGDSINLEFPNSETRRGRVGKQVAQTLDTGCNQGVLIDRIRRLTPLECFRLMDFNESFKWDVSDTQAYKQAGNSIPVGMLVSIIKQLKKLIS